MNYQKSYKPSKIWTNEKFWAYMYGFAYALAIGVAVIHFTVIHLGRIQ